MTETCGRAYGERILREGQDWSTVPDFPPGTNVMGQPGPNGTFLLIWWRGFETAAEAHEALVLRRRSPVIHSRSKLAAARAKLSVMRQVGFAGSDVEVLRER